MCDRYSTSWARLQDFVLMTFGFTHVRVCAVWFGKVRAHPYMEFLPICDASKLGGRGDLHALHLNSRSACPCV